MPQPLEVVVDARLQREQVHEHTVGRVHQQPAVLRDTLDLGLVAALRGGIAQRVFDGASLPRIPDGDRDWLSAGASYEPLPWLSVSAAYTRIFVEAAGVDLRATDTGGTFRGNMSGSYDSAVDIVALSARLRF